MVTFDPYASQCSLGTGIISRIPFMFNVQIKDREPSLGRGAKVVAVSLDKVHFGP